MVQVNFVAPCTLLHPVFFAAVVSCAWVAVLIFSTNFSVPSDHNGTGGLLVGLMVAVHARAGGKLSLWFEHAHPLHGVSHGPCG